MKHTLTSLILCLACMPQLWAYNVSLVETHGEPGEIISVPILIDAAGGLASGHLQINYDPIMLEYQGFETASSLSLLYTVVDQAIDGSVNLVLARENSLPGGTGVLIRLRMLVRPGNVPGTSSDLVISRCDLGGDFGADLSWTSSISHENTLFYVALSKTLDSDNDGLTDYEEQIADGHGAYNPYHAVNNPTGTDSDIQVGDTDGDGMSDGSEAIAGTSLVDESDVFGINLQPGRVEFRPGVGFVIQWQGKPDRVYDVERTADLTSPFLPLPGATNIPTHPVMNEVIDPVLNSSNPFYYRIGVRNP